MTTLSPTMVYVNKHFEMIFLTNALLFPFARVFGPARTYKTNTNLMNLSEKEG